MKGNLEDAFAGSSDQRVYTMQRNYSPNLEWLSYEMQGRGNGEELGWADGIYIRRTALHSSAMGLNILPPTPSPSPSALSI